jgi:hypothetical protein
MIQSSMMLLLLLGMPLVNPLSASAETPRLQLQITAGYDGYARENSQQPADAADGYAKEDSLVPVDITLTNSGEGLSGDLAVTTVNPVGGNDIVYLKQLELPAGSVKTVTFTMPSLNYNSKNSRVDFYKDGIAKNNPVSLPKNNYISLRTVSDVLVGGLTRDPDTLQFLALSGSNSVRVSPVPLDLAKLPTDPLLLSSLDALVFNDVSTDALTEDQVQAIQAWVRDGGKLIIAGGAQYAKTVQAFRTLAPLAYEKTMQTDTLSAFEQESGKPLKLNDPITLATGKLQSGKVQLMQNGTPLIMRTPLGSGAVYSMAYDLAEPSLSAWVGNADIWNLVLDPGGNAGANFAKVQVNTYYNLNRTLDLFPSIKPPDFKTLSLLFVLYSILVAPVLYLILKKFDKREWAWAIIPLLALVSTAGIYAVGAQDKSSTLAHELNQYYLSGDGGGSRLSYTAVFVPRSGNVDAEFPNGAHISPLSPDNSYNNINNSLSQNADVYLRQVEGKAQLEWKKVPFWSVRKVKWQQGGLQELGQFNTTVTLKASLLTGTVGNATPVDMQYVHIIVNGQLIVIGDLAAGESKPFSEPLTPNPARYSDDIANQMFMATAGSQTYEYERERRLISSVLEERSMNGQTSEPLVLGWSKDKQSDLRIEGKTPRTDRLNLYMQPITVIESFEGNVSLPMGYIKPKIVEQKMSNFYEMPNGSIGGENGYFDLEYQLPKEKAIDYRSLTFRHSANMPIALQIWNNQLAEWQPITPNGWEWSTDKEIASYVSSKKTIRFRIEVQTSFDMQLPEIALEGSVTP